MLPRIYVFLITFAGLPHYYYAVHKEKKFEDHYMGSPVTHKDFFLENLHLANKEILEQFEYSEEGYKEAVFRERDLTLPHLNDPLCLNEHAGGFFSLESFRLGGKASWKKPGFREQKITQLKKLWRDETFRAFMSELSSKRIQEKWKDEEYRTFMSESGRKAAEKQWTNNSALRDRYSKLMSDKSREMWKDPGMREKLCKGRAERITGENNPSLGKRWITDGTQEGTKLIDEFDELPAGYKYGVVRSNSGKGGSKSMWITDGTSENTKRIPLGHPIPEGFRRGRVLNKNK